MCEEIKKKLKGGLIKVAPSWSRDSHHSRQFFVMQKYVMILRLLFTRTVQARW